MIFVIYGFQSTIASWPLYLRDTLYFFYSSFLDPYPSEQQRYDEMCGTGGPGYGEPFGAETYRKSTPPVSTEYRDQRNTHFQQPGAVLMVYGLDPLRTNADKLFNLMCLYGNVARVST